MSRFLYIALLFFAFQAAGQRHFEVWNKNQVDFDLSSKTRIKAAEKVYYVPERSSVKLMYSEVLVNRHFKRWLEIGTGYRVTWYRNTANNWDVENRPMLSADLKHSFNDFKLTFYNRFEYRIFKTPTNHFRYRHAFKLQFPKLTDWGMCFYTSEEVFVKLNGEGNHLSRIYGGLNAFSNKLLKVNMYYAFEMLKTEQKWNNADIIGVDLKFSI